MSGTGAISESYPRAERVKAEALHQRDLEAIELNRKREIQQKELEDGFRNEEAIIRKKFDEEIAASFPPRPFWVYWLPTVILVYIGLAAFNPLKMSDSGVGMSSVVFGALAGWWLMSYIENKRKHSSSYVALEKQRDEELAAVRGGTPSQPMTQQVPPTNEDTAAKSHEQTDIQMYRQAAMDGTPLAQVFLGMMHLNGTRIPQNDDQAIAWFRKAAKQGNAEGQYRLGWMYKLGRGVVQDPVKAYMWASLAVMNGESRAGEMCEEIRKWLTPRREREAQEMVQKCRASYYQNCD